MKKYKKIITQYLSDKVRTTEQIAQYLQDKHNYTRATALKYIYHTTLKFVDIDNLAYYYTSPDNNDVLSYYDRIRQDIINTILHDDTVYQNQLVDILGYPITAIRRVLKELVDNNKIVKRPNIENPTINKLVLVDGGMYGGELQ